MKSCVCDLIQSTPTEEAQDGETTCPKMLGIPFQQRSVFPNRTGSLLEDCCSRLLL